MIIFENRADAGKKLAERIHKFLERQSSDLKSEHLVVVGLPRGGVPVALEVARKFKCQLEVLVSKKISHPGHREYAIGAVTSDGDVVLDPDLENMESWQYYIEEQRQILLHKTKEQEGYFYDRAGYIPSLFQDKIVIIVDDGIATGMTAIAAIETVRRRQAKSIIIASPVMSIESHHKITSVSNQVIADYIPPQFEAVGQFYKDFNQVSDQEVIQAMQESHHFGKAADMSFILQ